MRPEELNLQTEYVPINSAFINQQKAYKELVENIGDSLVSVEGLLPATQVVKAIKEVIESQVTYHKDNLTYYQIINASLK